MMVLESAEPDLQSMFKKPGADTASLGDGKQFVSAEINTDSGRRVVAAVQTWGRTETRKMLRCRRTGALSESGSAAPVRLVSGIIWHRWVAWASAY